MTAARSRWWRRTSSGAAGVGSTPARSASPPAAVTPAAIAASSISPDSRVSRTISTCGRGCSARVTAARASASASSAVRKSPARPRTPSVPNSWRAITRAATALALGELRALARLLQAGLLAFLHARVAGEEAAALQLAAQVRVGDDQRPRDAVAQGAGLGGDAAAVHAGDDIHAGLVADRLERLADDPLERLAWEELLERLAVDRVGAGARLEDHAGDRGLALAGGGVAGSRGEVDGRVSDRHLGVIGLLLLARRGRLGVRFGGGLGLGVEEVLALGDDVGNEVGAGDLGLRARGGLLFELFLRTGGHGLGGGGLLGRGGGLLGRGGGLLGRGGGLLGRGGGLLGRGGGLLGRGLVGRGLVGRGGRLVGARLGGHAGSFDAVGSVGARLGGHAGRLGGLAAALGLVARLVVLGLLGHCEISIGCGCWA